MLTTQIAAANNEQQKQQEVTYHNPVIPGFYPDPSVCRVGEDFYLVNSSFQFFPGVPIFHSRDLVNWEQIGNVLDRRSQLKLDGANCWAGIYAPTIRYNDGTFYMITTNCSDRGNFIVHAKDPRGPWSEPVWLEQGGIDPSLFFEDGKCYLVSNPSDCIWLSEIDPITGKQLSPSVRLWQGDGGRYPEAPHIYKKDGYYYLMIAEGGTEMGHSETIARSKDIRGPYQSNPANPILCHLRQWAQSNPIQGTGHADIVDAPDGSWWMVNLAFRPMSGGNHNLGRETFLAPVSWPEGGWPVVNGNGTEDLEMHCPTLPLQPLQGKFLARQPRDIHDFTKIKRQPLFGSDFLRDNPQFIFMRNPVEENYTFTGKGLQMKVTTDVISSEKTMPTFMARRQQHINFETRCTLSLNDAKAGDEAGLTLFMTEYSHYDLTLTRDDSGRQALRLRYKLIDLTHEEPLVTLPSGDITLIVSGDKEDYSFAYSTDGGKTVTSLGKMNTRYLSTECAGGFTGITIGMFAQSANATTNATAVVKSFDYKALGE